MRPLLSFEGIGVIVRYDACKVISIAKFIYLYIIFILLHFNLIDKKKLKYILTTMFQTIPGALNFRGINV